MRVRMCLLRLGIRDNGCSAARAPVVGAVRRPLERHSPTDQEEDSM
jgi:hypothetical protein